MAGVKVEEKFKLPSGHIIVLMDDEWGVEILGENEMDGETVTMGSWDFTTQEAWKEWGAYCIIEVEANKQRVDDDLYTEAQFVEAIYLLDRSMPDHVRDALYKE